MMDRSCTICGCFNVSPETRELIKDKISNVFLTDKGMKSLLLASAGALAVGAFAIGAMAIGKMAVGSASFKKLNVKEMNIAHLKVKKLEVETQV